jgi:hypothetical protein
MTPFRDKKEPMSDWALRSSVFMTIAQALSIGKQSPAAASVPKYSKLFSAIVARALKNDLIPDEIFQAIAYSPYQIQITKEDADLFKLSEADYPVYLQQGMALSKVLSRWNNSMSITNDDQMNIFSALAMECENLGMDKNDEEMLGLLFLVSLFYTTMLKDSQADQVNCEKWRSVGSFFATELPNLWLIEKSKN